ncbi:hypothetical protein F5B17DRAFT_443068 [Nemania serpens]|nr:hypothetical protein F5B17DRAFT_443068 [Nemania serpens]
MSSIQRAGSTCNYEPRPRKASDTRELYLPASSQPRISSPPEHNNSYLRSNESEDLENVDNMQSSSLLGSSPDMFSLDTNIDFLFSPGAFTSHNEPGDLNIAPPISNDYSIGRLADTQFPILRSSISTNTPLENSEFETGTSTVTENLSALSLTATSDSKGVTNLQTHSNAKNGNAQAGPLLWKNTDEATVHQCVQACFENNAEVSMFLRKDSVIGKILEMRETSQSDILSSLFSDAVIAMGLDIPRRNDDEGQAPSSHHSDYFALLLNASAGLYTSPSSLLKLQSVIASTINDPRKSELLAAGVHCVRDLRFNSTNALRRSFTRAIDQELVKRTVWVLYCLETSHSVTHGIPPLLHADFIDHLPAAPYHLGNHGLLCVQIAATTLLARSFSRIYMQSLSSKTSMELQACTSELIQWRHNLPDQARNLITGREIGGLRKDRDAGESSVSSAFTMKSMPPPQIESLHDTDALLGAASGGSATDHQLALFDTLRKCLESAYTIVSHANEIVGVDRTLVRRLRSLLIVSVCVITYGVQYGESETRKKSLAYLGICCGTFGGMYLSDSSLPFEEILDLVRTIRSDT